MKIAEVEKRFRERMRLKHLSWNTERDYWAWCVRYYDWLNQDRARWASADPRRKLEAYLTHLAVDREVAAATQNHALHALLFLYKEVMKIEIEGVNALRAKRGKHVRHAASWQDCKVLMEHCLDRNGYPVRLLIHLLYGAGLRLKETLNLRIKDLDFSTRRMVLHGAKGNKDRHQMIPESLLPAIATQVKAARAIWERDQEAGVPVKLPNAYGCKNPAAARQWGWAWLFPQHVPCKDPRTGETVRYHLHEKNIQVEVRRVVRVHGLDCMLTPHVLRHSYATHLLERGANPRDLQAAMGHEQLETTMTYLTPEIQRLTDPLQFLRSA